MAASAFLKLLLAPILLVVFIQIRYHYRWYRLRKWGTRQGCLEPKSIPNKLPWGIDHYAVFFRGLDGVDILEDLILSVYKSIGANTFRFYATFNETVINTSEPANIQAMYSSQFKEFDIGPFRKGLFWELLGNGIFTTEHDRWPYFHQQLKPQFARAQISDLTYAEKHVNNLFKVLPEEDGEGWIRGVDLMPYVYRMVMDKATEWLFGQSVDSQLKVLHCLDSGNEMETTPETEFDDAMTYCQNYIAWRGGLSSFYWLANSREYRDTCAIVKNYSQRYVDLAIKNRDESRKEKTLSSQYGEAQDKINKGQTKFNLLDELVNDIHDPTELRDQILHLLLAGRDTTSSLISWTLLLLSKQPSHFHSLRNLLLATFPIGEPITFESLKSCKPLLYTLYETLRLYPVLPVNSRTALHDVTLPAGGGPDGRGKIAVMRGEVVGFSTYILHRRKDIWGEDADLFRPERWEGRKLGWEFVPFGGGPRICLGQQYALTEASYALLRILQRYDKIEAVDGEAKPKKALGISLKPGDGVKVHLHRAASPSDADIIT